MFKTRKQYKAGLNFEDLGNVEVSERYAVEVRNRFRALSKNLDSGNKDVNAVSNRQGIGSGLRRRLYWEEQEKRLSKNPGLSLSVRP